jgi:hypothetical protein
MNEAIINEILDLFQPFKSFGMFRYVFYQLNKLFLNRALYIIALMIRDIFWIEIKSVLSSALNLLFNFSPLLFGKSFSDYI